MFKPDRDKPPAPQGAPGEPRMGFKRTPTPTSTGARMFLVASSAEDSSPTGPVTASIAPASLARPLAASPRFGLGRSPARAEQAIPQPSIVPTPPMPSGGSASLGNLTETPAQRRVVNDADTPRAIAIPSRIMAIAGDTCAGLLLAQLLYWTRRGALTAENDGWIFKTAAEWQQETGMSWKVQHRARVILLSRGLIEERRLSMPSRLEFRLKLSVLAKELSPHSDLELGDLSLPAFLDLPGEAVDRLVGRAFLFHSLFTRIWPVPTAMLCSRLVAGVKLNILALNAWSGSTRLIRLHRHAWQADTGLSRDQWQTARRTLSGAGVLIERRHNFPRRVDLGIDLAALAQALRSGQGLFPKGSPDPTFSDRPIPPTESPIPTFSGRPNQPTESPDPAFSDRPIPPLSVAQSHLYPVLDEGRQPPRHPTRAPEPPALPLVSNGNAWGGWGSKGYASQRTAISPMAVTDLPPSSSQANNEIASVALATLAWPALFTEDDKTCAGRHLAGLDRAIQQQLLDEIEWQHSQGKPVRSPVALTRALARKVNVGTFSADGAHRVAADRLRRAEEEAELVAKAAKRAAEAEARKAGQAPDTSHQDTRSPEVIARLEKILGRSVGRKSA